MDAKFQGFVIMKAIGCCKLSYVLVDIEGVNQPVPSCATAVADGMVLQTRSKKGGCTRINNAVFTVIRTLSCL